MSEITIKKLTEYCRDYVNLVAPSAMLRTTQRVKLSDDILDVKVLIERDFDIDYDDKIKLPFYLNIAINDVDSTNDEESDDDVIEDRITSDLHLDIAKNLDKFRRKIEANNYSKQLVLRFGHISFLSKVIDEDNRNSTITEIYKTKIDGYLFELPVSIISSDIGSQRKYDLITEDSFVKTNVEFLRNFLGVEYADELYKFIVTNMDDERTVLPLGDSYVDELWVKISTFLKFKGAEEITVKPDMSDVMIVLMPKVNYFLSQDLTGIIQNNNDSNLGNTSLSAWTDKEDKSSIEYIDDKGDHELFFPFPYDRYQLNVLSRINNKAIIVEGPPGTGKSQTISNILVHLAAIGKKVLFVSQKDQAIRGVKDKLKTLNIPHLYGYIPERTSKLHTEDDERDSAAFTLRNVQNYYSMKSRDYIPKESLNSMEELIQTYNSSLSDTRKFAGMYEEWRKLDKYDFAESHIITKEWYSDIITRRVTIQSLKDKIQTKKNMLENSEELLLKQNMKLEDSTMKLTLIEDKFRISYGWNWSEITRDVIKGIGYERLEEIASQFSADYNMIALDNVGNILTRSYSNWKLNKMIRKEIDFLPEDIQNVFKQIISMNKSKTEKSGLLLNTERLFSEMNGLIKETEMLSLEIAQIGRAIESLHEEIGVLENQMLTEFKVLSRELLDEREMTRFEGLYDKDKDSVFVSISRRQILSSELKNQESVNLNEVRREILDMKKEYGSQVSNYVKNRITSKAKAIHNSREHRSIIESVARKLSKTKTAYKTFDRLKSDPRNFNVMSEIIPIWMMGLDDASRIIPLKANIFDYVILDEASQCNIAYTLPVMFRSKHALFFGDTLQMRDTTILFKSNSQLLTLANRYSIPEDLQIKAEGDSVKSVMDIAKLNGFESMVLRKHYRSPREIIGFSNENFYAPKNRRLEVVNDNILATEEGRVMTTYVVESEEGIEVSSKTNYAEALFIKELIEKLRSTKATEDKSIAVLSFFREQAELLERVINDKSIKVSSIEGIQGDEKDIVIYSLVIRSPRDKSKYIALTGEGGEVQKEINEGRVNVAFSRARLQVYAVTSLDPRLWPEGIWIKKYLEYIEKNGRVNRLSKSDQQFDSHFEEQVYDFLVQNLNLSRYRVATQVKSCGFFIDQVISDIKTGKKLAIECDGPTHFDDGDGQVRVESDFERQYILETAHWEFYRISYIDWQRKKESTKKEFLEAIDKYFAVEIEEQSRKVQADTHTEYQPIYVKVPLEQVKKEIETQRNKEEAKKNRFGGSISSRFYKEESKVAAISSVQMSNSKIMDLETGSTKTNINITPNIAEKRQQIVFNKKSHDIESIVESKPERVVTKTNQVLNERILLTDNIMEGTQSTDILQILKNMEIEFIDKRSNEGALWVIGGEELRVLLESYSDKGLHFKFKKEGGKQSKGRAAWWAK